MTHQHAFWWMLVVKASPVSLVITVIITYKAPWLSDWHSSEHQSSVDDYTFPIVFAPKGASKQAHRQISQKESRFSFRPFTALGFSQQKPKANSQWGLRISSSLSNYWTPTTFSSFNSSSMSEIVHASTALRYIILLF